MDDQAETFLMRLARGASTKGLASIHPVAGHQIRPLIEARRREILDYLQERELSYLEDASNQDRRFTRNRLRHDVIPSLSRALNPRLVETLARNAALARDDEDYLENVSRESYGQLARRDPGGLRLRALELRNLHPAIQRRVVRLAVLEAKGDVRGVTRRHVEDVLALLAPGRSGKQSHLPRLVVERSFDNLWIRPSSGRAARELAGNGYNGFEYRLTIPCRLPIRENGGLLTVDLVGESREGIEPLAAAGRSVDIAVDGETELKVRSPKPSDRFHPLGAPGTKSLARYLMERKVAKENRRHVPLVVRARDDSDEILWVAGHAVSESVRFRAGRRRLHLEWMSP